MTRQLKMDYALFRKFGPGGNKIAAINPTREIVTTPTPRHVIVSTFTPTQAIE